MSTVAAVRLWGQRIGAVALPEPGAVAAFEYDRAFLRSGIELSPLRMPARRAPYTFGALGRETFRGLPGMLADSLPDRFGNALIDVWLARQGRAPESFDAVERLCYIGARGMGALEFEPALGPAPSPGRDLHVAALVELASEVLAERGNLAASFDGHRRAGALRDILTVGTSAGGARAKAVIAYNPATQAVRSGQLPAEPGFEHWLLKFDGVDNDRHRDPADPQGYGAIEFAYANMARAAGIEMTDCRLLEENGRRHFMTRRFDRPDGRKLHMQSLGALAHFDFIQAGAYSYEQALMVIRRLGLSMTAVEQQFRRMAFNVIARNQDDHVKNVAFLMNPAGRWALSPAFDMTYAYNPSGAWTGQHQMTVNAKSDNFTLDDFRVCAQAASMKRGASERIAGEVLDAVGQWLTFAQQAGVPDTQAQAIARAQRLRLPRA